MEEIKEQEVKNTTEEVKEEGDFKVKKKPKKFNKKKNDPIKLDLTKKQEEDAVSESSTVHVDENKQAENVQAVESGTSESGLQEITEKKEQEENREKVEEVKQEDAPVIQEITNEEETETKEIVADIQEEIKTKPQLDLPENVEKLVDFIKETGGTVEDYVRLNADYTNVDSTALLKEYYKKTKPHLNSEEIDFLMEDNFHYDEDMDEERDIRKKQLAIKEEVAKAKNFLEDLKTKYYDEIKLRPGVTQEQQKATEFFNRYNKEQEATHKKREEFIDTTNKYFSNEFKGFEFNLGEKKFRYGVKNPSEVAESQSNISTFVKKFLDQDGNVTDHKGYHKALYAAQNVDTIAEHFYEQGKADAIKNVAAKSKNISSGIRQSPDDSIYLNGLRVKAVSGIDSSKLRIKTKKRQT